MATPQTWYFWHNTKRKGFGPYLTCIEAAEAFQRVYGYWPDTTTVTHEEYVTA